MTPIFYIKNGNLSFGDKNILSTIELYVSRGDKICLVGRNGSGKSSLMKVICGEYELDGGEMYQAPALTIGYLKQDMKLVPNCSVYDFVLQGVKNPEEDRYLADMILAELQLDGSLDLSKGSGGQIRRSYLARSLVSQPEILLLDEPTNHLDIAAIEWLEGYLQNYPGAVICISHDRAFQSNITNKVWWIDRAELRKSNRGFRYYDSWRDEIIAEEEALLRKLNRKLEAEKGWLNTGVTARRKRNQKRLANLHSLRAELREHNSKLVSAKNKLQLNLDAEVKKMKFIIEAENISFSYKNRPGDYIGDVLQDEISGSGNIIAGTSNIDKNNIISDFSIKVQKGEKIGIIGPNGSGKSTLIKILLKQLSPDSGKVRRGNNLEVTYFDQHRSELNPEHSLQLTLCPGGGDQVFLHDRHMHVAAYLKKFMFDPKSLHSKVATLSGGEANRLLLAKALIRPGNFLVLDEPTNDLDIDSLEMLLEMLADYDGTLLVVSHDRDFLERLVTRTLVFTHNNIIDIYGGYEDYLKYHQNRNQANVNGVGGKGVSSKTKVINSAKSRGDKSSTKNSYDKPALDKAGDGKDAEKGVAINKFVQEEDLSAPGKGNKLSYKYQRLLEVLPQEIAKIEEKIASIESALSSGDLYNDNPQKFTSLTDQLIKSNEELESKLTIWVELDQQQKS